MTNGIKEKGAFQIARKIFESELWLTKPCSWKVIWIYIIGKVNHKDNKMFKRGENYFNFTKELKCVGSDITIDMVKKFLKWARQNSMISTKKSTRGIVIFVNKYEPYQTLSNYTSTTESTTKSVLEHLPSTTINKNIENNTIVLDDKSSLNSIKINKSNKMIDYIIGKTKELSGTPTLDDTNQVNRNMASNLIRNKIKPEFVASGINEPTDEQIKSAIDKLFEKARNSYWGDKIKSVSKIYYKFQDIIK